MGAEEERHLYFVIRSLVLGLVSGILFLSFVWLLGTVDFGKAVAISILVFVASLFISRLFDAPITSVVRRILRLLEKREKLRKLILRYL